MLVKLYLFRFEKKNARFLRLGLFGSKTVRNRKAAITLDQESYENWLHTSCGFYRKKKKKLDSVLRLRTSESFKF